MGQNSLQLNISTFRTSLSVYLSIEVDFSKFQYCYDAYVHVSINFSHILPDNKNTNTVTPQFYLSFRKDMPNTTKYSQSRNMAIFKHKKIQVFSLKFHDFPFKSMHY